MTGWILLIACALSVACSKKDDPATVQDATIYTNCKLPKADGLGSVAIGGFPRYTDRLSSTSVVATVIMVDFSDSPATMTPATAYAKISGATDTFTEMSYGKFKFNLNPVQRWYRMSKPSTEYSLQSGASTYIREAIDISTADVDFSTTDLLIILSNPDTTGLGEAGPAHPYAAGHGITADGKEILNVVTSAHDLNDWGSIWLNHETGHMLGLPDLYASTASDPSIGYADTLRYSGQFSYMGFNSFTSNAPGLTAWERWILGWVDDSQINCANPLVSGEINQLISPISVSTGTKAVVVPIGETKVLVVESRRASGIDAKIAKTGALVYTIDSSIKSSFGPLKVYPFNADDRMYLYAPRQKGESVAVGGLKVTVVDSSDAGDTVRITAGIYSGL